MWSRRRRRQPPPRLLRPRHHHPRGKNSQTNLHCFDYFDCGTGSPLLLTDGTVMLQDAGCQDWWKLTPDSTGSYLNGTWTQLASTPAGYSPLYHSSAVLPDGRVIIEGGEYNFLKPAWTNLGAIYDPLANTWTSVAPPRFSAGSRRSSRTQLVMPKALS